MNIKEEAEAIAHFASVLGPQRFADFIRRQSELLEQMAEALASISLCSQSSMSSKHQCGEIARAALAAYRGEQS